MKVAEVMTKEVITIHEDATVSNVAKLLMENRFSGLPVVNESGELVGVVTESDLLPKLKKVPFARGVLPALCGEWIDENNFDECIAATRTKKVSEVMSTSPLTVGPDEEMGKAAELMTVHEVKRLPVVVENKLVGIISSSDILRTLAE